MDYYIYFFPIVLYLTFLYLLFPLTVKSLLRTGFLFLWGSHNMPSVHYHKDSVFCKRVVRNCPILRERYTPPLWGYIGHLQTFWFGLKDAIIPTVDIKGKRHFIYIDDGSTLIYDIFNPPDKANDEVILLVPGISNSSETDYIRSFVLQANQQGYIVAVFNHIGALKDFPITGHRIFTYGGTGDLTLMFEHLISNFETNTKFIGVGFSMGALILLRFLGEQTSKQNKFVCAISVSQGYSSQEAIKLNLRPWQDGRCVYWYGMTKRLLKLLKRHKEQLYTNHPIIKKKLSTSVNGCVSRSPQNGTCIRKSVSVPCLSRERDSNGFSVDPNMITVPDERMWSASSFKELDEYYTRRIMGFESYKCFVKWMSCVEHFYQIPDLPVLCLNAYDDPVIPRELTKLPIEYTEFNHKAMFVGTDYGGHVAFTEGGWIFPNRISWSERLIFQYIASCKQ